MSNYVTLSNAGIGTKKGLCPFHEEKSPSFTVRESTSTFHCFGCGEGGDVFSFVMKINGTEFYEALEYVATKSGISIKWEENTGSNRSNNGQNGDDMITRSRLIELNGIVCDEFMKNIELPEAKPARDLLQARNFTRDDCVSFGCGYATKSQDDLSRMLTNKGFTINELVQANISNNSGGRLRDRFQGRLIWPIKDISGDVLGFGARKLYDDDFFEAKFLNTSETRVYKKSKVLYGIDKARKPISDKRQVVVVEGYADVMAMHLAGIDTAVATCGTAFGGDHALVLRRLMGDEVSQNDQMRNIPKQGGKIIFTFDGDSAGLKAAWRSFEFMADHISQCYVAIIPDNMDPCDLRIKQGDEALHQVVKNAKPIITFMLDTALAGFDLTSIEGATEAATAGSNIIALIDNDILLDQYIGKLASITGAKREQISKLVMNAKRANRRNSNENYFVAPSNPKSTKSNPEKEYFTTLLQCPEKINVDDFFIIKPEMLKTAYFRKLYQVIADIGALDYAKSVDQKLWIEDIRSHLNENESKWLDLLTVDELKLTDEDQITGYFKEISQKIKYDYLLSQRNAKQKLISTDSQNGSDISSLHSEIMELTKQINKLKI